MSTCKGCGKTGFRKGTLVTLFAPGRKPTGAKVCGECAAGGMLVVAQRVPAPVVQKVARPDGYDRVLRMLRTYASAARSTSESYKAEDTASDYSHFSGKAEGIEIAIETIRREMGGAT